MNRIFLGASAAAISALGLQAPAHAAETEPLTEFEKALADSKALFTVRTRLETVDQEGFDKNAEAVTTRIRAGFETGSYKGFKFLIDFDHIESQNERFNSTINGETSFPVVPDPDVTELNRFQVSYAGFEDTMVTVGRQRIIHDDARFVGNVGWRQNEQTYDAVRIVNKSVKNLKVDVSYIDQVNRIFGDDSPIGIWDSNSIILDVDYKVPLEGGDLTISGFAYVLDFDNAAAASSATYGGMVQGKKGLFFGKVRAATQSDHGDAPVEYTAQYISAEAGIGANGWSGLLGYELLGSDDGVKAFATPLATLHKFNGFADLFLGTPATGLEDLYATVSYTKKNVGPAKMIKAFATYHTFSSDEGDTDFGTEFNAVATASFGRTKVLFKYADYQADVFAGDRAKFWAQVDWTF